jgi:hypothetical protein
MSKESVELFTAASEKEKPLWVDIAPGRIVNFTIISIDPATGTAVIKLGKVGFRGGLCLHAPDEGDPDYDAAAASCLVQKGKGMARSLQLLEQLMEARGLDKAGVREIGAEIGSLIDDKGEVDPQKLMAIFRKHNLVRPGNDPEHLVMTQRGEAFMDWMTTGL